MCIMPPKKDNYVYVSQMNMTELKKQIIGLTISNETAGFFRDKEFQWNSIPEFAVIPDDVSVFGIDRASRSNGSCIHRQAYLNDVADTEAAKENRSSVFESAA